MDKGDNNIKFFGKIARLPRKSKPESAVNFLERIKISKQRLWYLIVEKQDDELQMIKYNNRCNINITLFIENLKDYYSTNKDLCDYISKLSIEGSDRFTSIKNIPDVEFDGKKLITIITEDLIKLLH
jgi:hypothetical protein